MKKQKPIFGYVKKESFEGEGYDHTYISKRRTDETMQRVALIPVPPSLLDKAFDDMTKDEKIFLNPPWKASFQTPTIPDLIRIADYFNGQAKLLLSTARKFKSAAEAAKEADCES